MGGGDCDPEGVGVVISLTATRLTLPHFCAHPKPGPKFQSAIVIFISDFEDRRLPDE